MEELKGLEPNQNPNLNPNNIANQKIDQSQENSFEGDKAISLKDDENQEKKINNTALDSIIDENHHAFKLKTSEIVYKENNENNAINQVKDYTSHHEIKALIPLPPKPKYSYLNKWLLRLR